MTGLYFLAVAVAILGILGFTDCGTTKSGLKPYCENGYAGDCGPYNNFRCPKGTICRKSKISRIGLCCNLKPMTEDVCPPSSGPGICVFDPKVNCLGDQECPQGYMCCPEGCGSVCKNRKSGAVYPGPLPGTTM